MAAPTGPNRLCSPGIKEFGLETQWLRFKSLGNGVDGFHDEPVYRLPVPARYVTDNGGIIRAADVNPNYTIGSDTSETAEVLRALKQ